jgi:hypothetical protein
VPGGEPSVAPWGPQGALVALVTGLWRPGRDGVHAHAGADMDDMADRYASLTMQTLPTGGHALAKTQGRQSSSPSGV